MAEAETKGYLGESHDTDDDVPVDVLECVHADLIGQPNLHLSRKLQVGRQPLVASPRPSSLVGLEAHHCHANATHVGQTAQDYAYARGVETG